MCRLSWNLGTSASWKPQVRPAMGLLYLLKLYAKNAPETKLVYQSARRCISEDYLQLHCCESRRSQSCWSISLPSFLFHFLYFVFPSYFFLFSLLCVCHSCLSLSALYLPCPLPLIYLVPYSSSLSQCRTFDLHEVQSTMGVPHSLSNFLTERISMLSKKPPPPPTLFCHTCPQRAMQWQRLKNRTVGLFTVRLIELSL
jgi:hypothetical protein